MILSNKKLFKTLSLAFLLSAVTSADARVHATYKPVLVQKAPGDYYLGIFGGGGHVRNASASQEATVFFPAAAGGLLDVDATGNTGGSAGIVGMHFGYQWHGWNLEDNTFISTIKPALEMEGYYLANKQHAYLFNPTDRVPEHFFEDNFPMNTGVMLANTVFSFKTHYYVDPYIGVGLGTALVSIADATSAQDSPPEYGINHFNSHPDAFKWTFAAQAKFGLRYNITDKLNVFAEYRFLYLNNTDYTFGSTQYPTHVPTSNWHVMIGDMGYGLGSVGFDYSL
jgi:opacity protein-like surface antigen